MSSAHALSEALESFEDVVWREANPRLAGASPGSVHEGYAGATVALLRDVANAIEADVGALLYVESLSKLIEAIREAVHANAQHLALVHLTGLNPYEGLSDEEPSDSDWAWGQD